MKDVIKIICLVVAIIDFFIFVWTKDLYWGIFAIIMYENYKL